MNARAMHRIPKVVEQLGTLLDLTVAHGAHRMLVDDWKGWLLLAPCDAMTRGPGAGRLYLINGKLGADFDRETAEELLRVAGDTYAQWHQREPERARKLQHKADAVGTLLGRVERIGYRSDKFGRRNNMHDYDHDFRERDGRPPKLWIDAKTVAGAHTAVITGGDFIVRPEGIC